MHIDVPSNPHVPQQVLFLDDNTERMSPCVPYLLAPDYVLWLKLSLSLLYDATTVSDCLTYHLHSELIVVYDAG